MGRVIYQAGMRVVVGMKDQATKCDPTLKSARSSSSSSTQARRFSGALDSAAFNAVKNAEERLKQAEESLRTVMYLSCWGPN